MLSPPTRRITTIQFALLALPSHLSRKIVAVHLHHTWRPRRDDFRGAATIDAMRRVHMERNGWSDIAQHLTIDPSGGLWTGRNWNMAPASAAGHNGDANEGPFMIELIGDFDEGQDPFDGAQRQATIQVVSHLMRAFDLKDEALRFHNEMAGRKTCPGSSINRAALLKDVHQLEGQTRVQTQKSGLFRVEHLLGAEALRSGAVADNVAAASVPENEATAGVINDLAREAVRDVQSRTRAARGIVPARGRFMAGGGDTQRSVLRPHVINLAKGELSEDGAFRTTPGDVEAIVDAIRDYATGTETPRLMIHAHGGLVGESDALDYARTMYRWWLDHGIYPVFFIWETSLLEILGQFVLGRRDVFDFTTDFAIEGMVKAPGTAVWAGMKESARLASSLDTGEGAVGGARLFARKLTSLVRKAVRPLPVYAVGHSAGAIFQAHFVPALLDEGLTDIERLCLLAPAVRTELFRDNLRPLFENRKIKALSMFTMEEEAEEQDHCFQVYRKSLLYLVSHACEGLVRRPILGLHRSLRKDAELRALFGLNADGSPGAGGAAELQLSLARDKAENPLTRSLAHGGFDNDPKTMSAVLRRVLDIADSTAIGEADFPFPPLSRALDLAPFVSSSGPAWLSVATSTPTAPGIGGGLQRLKALCIGIDAYPERPLAGCVNDARSWGRSFSQLGAHVDYLFDDEATYEGMMAAIRSLIRSGAPGDVLILQYAGHGGQLPRRVDSESDGFNEAVIPVDFDTGALLVDDELAQILGELPAGVAITLFMDCCHSGTNSRFAPVVRARAAVGDKPRFMPLSDDVVEAYFSKRGVRALGGGADVALRGVVHFAACQDHEYAWESNGQGDFTGAAARTLVAAVQDRLTNEQFAKQIADAVGARGRQHPQLMELDAAMTNRPVLAAAVAV